MLRQALISAMIFVIIPTLLWAQEASNMISGAVGDRDVSVPIRAEQSDFYGDGNAGGVSILTTQIARDDGLGAISIGFEGSDFLGGDIFSFEISIADRAAENRSEYFADLDHDLQITITRAEKSDAGLWIAGTVQGTLIWRQLMPGAAQMEDPSRQLSIDLAFDAVVEDDY
jgi:hypothetical protein